MVANGSNMPSGSVPINCHWYLIDMCIDMLCCFKAKYPYQNDHGEHGSISWLWYTTEFIGKHLSDSILFCGNLFLLA